MIDAKFVAEARITFEGLSDGELARVQPGWWLGEHPRELPFYAKIAHLFTYRNGTEMHPAVQVALEVVIMKRLLLTQPLVKHA